MDPEKRRRQREAQRGARNYVTSEDLRARQSGVVPFVDLAGHGPGGSGGGQFVSYDDSGRTTPRGTTPVFGAIPAPDDYSPLSDIPSDSLSPLASSVPMPPEPGKPPESAVPDPVRDASVPTRRKSAPVKPPTISKMQELENEYGESVAAEQEAIGEARKRLAISESSVIASQAAAEMAQQELAEKQMASAQAQQAVHERGRKQVDETLKELEAFQQSAKVDPDRFFRDRGTGGAIIAAVSMAMGQYGASMNGGPNAAAEFISKAVDRDIQSQRDALERKERGLQGAYVAARHIAEDDEEATLLGHKLGIEAARSKIQGLTNGIANEQMRAQGIQLDLALAQESQKVGQEFGRMKMAKEQARLNAVARQQAARRKAEADRLALATQLPVGVQVADPLRAQGTLSDKPTMRQIQSGLASANKIESALEEWENADKEVSFGEVLLSKFGIDSQDVTDAKSLEEDVLLPAMNKLQESGVMQQSDIDRIMDRLPDSTSVWGAMTGNERRKAKSLRTGFRKTLDGGLRSYGLTLENVARTDELDIERY